MKIIYVTSSPVPSQAANSVHVVKMAQALKSGGHDVTLVSPLYEHITSHNKNLNLAEIYGIKGDFIHKIFSVLPIKGGVLLHAIRVALYAKIKKVDLVFSRCLICAWVSTMFGIKTIFERHDSLDSQSLKVKNIFNKLINSKNLLKIVVITKSLREHLIKQHNIPSEQFIIAADGADPLPEDIESIDINYNTNRPKAGYIGHLYQGRGIDIIIGMASKMPNVDFHIVGGKDEDLKYWKKRASSINNLIFHGHVTHKETVSYLVSFDYLLAPYQKKVIVSGGEDTSRWMSPLKVFEYMSAGKPIICSNIDVLKEVIIDEYNAVLCIPDDVDDWCKKLDILINTPDLSSALGATALNDFMTKYTWQSRSYNIISIAFKNKKISNVV